MLCVLAKLSDDATEKLNAIKGSAIPDNEGAKPLHGHITLASYEGEDEAGFTRSCKELFKDIRHFDIRYEKMEIFEDPFVIVVKPERSETLSNMHQLITEKFNDTLNKWTKAGIWNPHTSLYAGSDPDLPDIFQKMSDAFIPFTAAVDRIEFSLVLENGYEIIDSIDLRPAELPV